MGPVTKPSNVSIYPEVINEGKTIYYHDIIHDDDDVEKDGI